MFYKNLYFFPEDPPPEQGAMEVHNFFASCVEEEERKEDSGDMESHGRQLVLQYMSDTKLTRFQCLLDFWREMSGWARTSCQEAASYPRNKYSF